MTNKIIIYYRLVLSRWLSEADGDFAVFLWGTKNKEIAVVTVMGRTEGVSMELKVPFYQRTAENSHITHLHSILFSLLTSYSYYATMKIHTECMNIKRGGTAKNGWQ